MKKVILLCLAMAQAGCFVGETQTVYHQPPTKTVYKEPERVVHVEVVYYEEDNHYYEFYNHFGEWCYGEYDWDSPGPDCFVEWCYDHVDDWWYEWSHYCQSEPYYDDFF